MLLETSIPDEMRTLNTAEAAESLGMSKSTLYKMIKEGTIEAEKKNGRYEILESSIDDFKNRKSGGCLMFFLLPIIVSALLIHLTFVLV